MKITEQELAASVVFRIWKPPSAGQRQWKVKLGGLSLTVNAKSHQAAKRAAIEFWASCCADPESFMKSLRARAAEKWRGGLRAKMCVKSP